MAPRGDLPILTRRGRRLLIAAFIFILVLVFGPRLVDTYTSWLWFGEIGYRSVWAKVLLTRIVLFLVVTVLIGGSLSLAILLAYRSRPVFFPGAGSDDPVERYRTMAMSRSRLFGLGIPLAFGVIFGLIAQTDWATVQLFLHGGAFGIDDPQFGHDIAFYVFDLPFYLSVLNWLFGAVFLAFLASLATHYLFGGIRLTAKRGALTRAARTQLAVLAGSLVLLKAVAYWFDRYSLLSSGRKEPTFTGAGYTGINAELPAKYIMLSIAVICAAAFFAVIVLHDLRIPALAAALLLLSSILVGGVWPLIVEQFSVQPNAAVMEAPYIARNIAATRQAYEVGPNDIEYQDYPGVGTVPPREVPADVTTIENIRLLDPNVLTRTFTQQQQLKNFYEFTSPLDVDRYEINGELQGYIVAVRELSPDRLTGNQTHWVNRRTVYTHGNGFVAAPANRVNEAVRETAEGVTSSDSGYPIYTVSDIASQGTGRQLIPVEQPRVYYGEVIASADPDYAIVGGPGGPREYDTDISKYTYDGAGGVPIGNWLNRVAFAAKYFERNILFSEAIGEGSKILFDRDPSERVEQVAPWLTVDHNPYPAVVDGRIVWIVDAYTTVDNYPYAQRTSLDALHADESAGVVSHDEISYARNSVKATVDAYDGTVTLYQFDTQDPVLKAWMQVFPGTVEPEAAISDQLRAHFRYPEDLFEIQREIIAKYHVDDPREFFTTNAFWSVPGDPTVDANPHQPPYYVLVGDHETADPSFRLAGAMVGYHREFLSAYISAYSDPEQYGKIRVLELPTDTLTQGPQQIQNSMISDTRVASERTLLERSNRIHYGNLLALPIAKGGMLYVEPLFTERISTLDNTSTFPQLSRVLVSYGDPETGGVRVGYAPTVGEALDQVFVAGTGQVATAPGGDAATPPPTAAVPPPAPTPGVAPAPTTPPPADSPAALELQAAVDNLRAAQKDGNFTAIGEALDRLLAAVDAYLGGGGG